MPLDMLITGRIATLAGDSGFGWVEAIGIRDGRVAFAGSEVDLETRADPVHRADLARARRGRDPRPHRRASPSRRSRRRPLARRPDRCGDARRRPGADRRRPCAPPPIPEAWLEGHGWDSDRWGGWPTAAALETVAPGRRGAFWAHDHHALLASRAALAAAGIDRADRRSAGGVIGRDPDGDPDGVLFEAATRLVIVLIPPLSTEALEAAIVTVSRELLRARGRRRPRPGQLDAGPGPRLGVSGLRASVRARQPADPGPRLDPRRRPRHGARRRPAQRRHPRRRPARSARVGWQKCFADGSLGSRTAALLEPTSSPSPTDRSPRTATRRLDHPAGRPSRAGRPRRGGRDRDPDPRHRRRGGPRRARRPDPDRPPGPVHAQDRARPAARPGGPSALRGGRHRGQRPARPPRIGRDPGAPAVGRPGRTERLHLGVDRGQRGGHRLRDRRAGRAVRPVAGHRARRPARGSDAGRPGPPPSPRTRRLPLDRALGRPASIRPSPRASSIAAA